mgnify:FL=1
MAHRVNVTLSDQDYETLKAYASLLGITPTNFAGKLIEELCPSFKVVIEASKLAENNKDKAMNALNKLALSAIAHTATVAQLEITGS